MMDFDGVFQIDHPFVKAHYETSNYKVIIDESESSDSCAIYFSSHNIYYPNSESAFLSRVVDSDAYEWFGLRFKGIRKHVYVRDVHKQWYLTGINSRVNTPAKLVDLLREIVGASKLVTIGSSAGGYAAVLFGVALGAERIYSFNGQFELASLLESSSAYENPIVFREANGGLREYYDLRAILSGHRQIFYFYSVFSPWDAAQERHVRGGGVTAVGFRTAHHGIPFLKCALPNVMEMAVCDLVKLSHVKQRPLAFSVRISGLWEVINFLMRLSTALVFRRVRKLFPKGSC